MADNQFELYYQAQNDTHTGEIVGFEALLRWNHPERGRVSPAEFIPLAEETGQIIEIGDWVMRTACAAAAKWPGLKVAVNLSPRAARPRRPAQSSADPGEPDWRRIAWKSK